MMKLVTLNELFNRLSHHAYDHVVKPNAFFTRTRYPNATLFSVLVLAP